MTGTIVTVVRLPNGKLEVIGSEHGHLHEVFESEESLKQVFQAINEGIEENVEFRILETING